MNLDIKPIEGQLKAMYGDMYNYWRVFSQDQFGDHVTNLSLNYMCGCAIYTDGWNHFKPYPEVGPASGWFGMVKPLDEEENFRFGWNSCYRYLYYTVQNGPSIDDVKDVMRFSENPPKQYYHWWPVGGWYPPTKQPPAERLALHL